MSENRILRERHQGLANWIDRVRPRRGEDTPKFLGQVYDGGAMPNFAPAVFLTRPVEVDFDDVEGAMPMYTVDMAESIPVIVLRNVPSAGDMLAAFKVGSQWVAERGSTTTPLFTCGSCTIPESNINLTTSGTGSFSTGPNGTFTLVYSSSTWNAGVQTGTDPSSGLPFWFFMEISCAAGGLVAQYSASSVSSSGPFTLFYSSAVAGGTFGRLLTDSQTCGASFHWVLHVCDPFTHSCVTGEWMWTFSA